MAAGGFVLALDSVPTILQFGTLPPVVILQHEGLIYSRMVKEPTTTPATNRAQKRAFSQIKEECHDIIAEAKAMLKGFPLTSKTKAELVVALDAVCENLRQSVTLARLEGRLHARRNCRRRIAKAQRL